MHLKNAPSIQIALGRNTKTTHEPNGIPLGRKSEETPGMLTRPEVARPRPRPEVARPWPCDLWPWPWPWPCDLWPWPCRLGLVDFVDLALPLAL